MNHWGDKWKNCWKYNKRKREEKTRILLHVCLSLTQVVTPIWQLVHERICLLTCYWLVTSDTVSHKVFPISLWIWNWHMKRHFGLREETLKSWVFDIPTDSILSRTRIRCTLICPHLYVRRLCYSGSSRGIGFGEHWLIFHFAHQCIENYTWSPTRNSNGALSFPHI